MARDRARQDAQWPAPNWRGCGGRAWQAATETRQRGRNGQSVMRIDQVGRHALGSASGGAHSSRRPAASSPSGPACSHGSAGGTARGSARIRRRVPAYMTLTRSHRPATTPRSWLIQITDVPRSRVRRFTRSMICAWMVTSSAVVASSAISRSRIAGERDGDHHALAHAAGELVRIGVEPLLRHRDADGFQQLDRRACAPRRRRASDGDAAPRSSGGRS